MEIMAFRERVWDKWQMVVDQWQMMRAGLGKLDTGPLI